MKLQHHALSCTLALILTTTLANAQGRGGGAGGSRGAGRGNAGMPSAVPPANAPDSTPGRQSGRPDAQPDARPDQPGKGKASAAGAAQDLASSMHDINQTAFAQRKHLFATVDMRLKSSQDALRKIQTDAKNLRADARSDFKAALADVKTREREVTDSLKASRKATEATWPNDRETLARAYRSHAEALARLDAVVHAPNLPAPPSLPKP